MHVITFICNQLVGIEHIKSFVGAEPDVTFIVYEHLSGPHDGMLPLEEMTERIAAFLVGYSQVNALLEDADPYTSLAVADDIAHLSFRQAGRGTAVVSQNLIPDKHATLASAEPGRSPQVGAYGYDIVFIFIDDLPVPEHSVCQHQRVVTVPNPDLSTDMRQQVDAVGVVDIIGIGEEECFYIHALLADTRHTHILLTGPDVARLVFIDVQQEVSLYWSQVGASLQEMSRLSCLGVMGEKSVAAGRNPDNAVLVCHDGVAGCPVQSD